MAFFLLVYQVAPLPLAALYLLLLSVSIADISASRIANVESHAKFAPILSLALLAWARQKNRWEIYALSGLALAIGTLTYDTVLPMLGVVGLLVFIDLFRGVPKLLFFAKCARQCFSPGGTHRLGCFHLATISTEPY